MTIATSTIANQDAHNDACVAARKVPEVVALREQFETEAARRPADFKLWSSGRLSCPKLDRLRPRLSTSFTISVILSRVGARPVHRRMTTDARLPFGRGPAQFLLRR